MTVIHKKRTVDDVDKAADVGVKYHCDFCQVNITSTVRIKCANCTDFDLCVKCFTHGVEIGKHKNDHDYQVVDKHTFPIFDSSWGADEELLLIEALEIYGMGNWADAADHVGTKNKEECEQHYIDTYVNSETWPLPNMNLDFSPEIDAVSDRKKVKVTKQALNRYGKPLQSMPSNHEIAGYMPGRYEFETEYDNEAEQYVKDLVFGEEDTPEETELKLTVFEIYNSKLDKRTERKKFIFQRGLLDYRKNLANERKRTKEERDLINKTKVFARLQTADDYEKFLAGLINEMALRKRIAELQEYRRNGITTLAEAEVYERDKAQRQSNLKLLTGRESLAASERLSRYASRHVPQE
ncbi:Transcriptional adapter ada2, partial [Basidiobolus ranarum]